MKLLPKLLKGALVMLTGFSFQAIAADPAAREKLRQFEEQREAIYAHMKRYGINRDDVAAMRRLYEASPPYSDPHVNILTENLLNPGEHFRIEMDEYILTMRVPDAKPAASWIWPYNNTRQPDPAMEKYLKQSKGALKVANLGWYVCNSIFPPGLFGRCETMGVSMTYRILQPDERENFSTPEKLRQLTSKIWQNSLPSQEKIDASLRHETVINHAATRTYLAPEIVAVNGRVWVRAATSRDTGRTYNYATALSPDRMLGVSFGIPHVDYNTDPDPSTYPAPVKRALAQMEELLASLRIAKINDDGTHDPFVIERLESAPLPVREQLPTPSK